MENLLLNPLQKAVCVFQYAERMSQLATDPLVRLQMAGVNPEIPGGGAGAAAAAAAAQHSMMQAAAAQMMQNPAYASLLGAAAQGNPNAAAAAALQVHLSFLLNKLSKWALTPGFLSFVNHI